MTLQIDWRDRRNDLPPGASSLLGLGLIAADAVEVRELRFEPCAADIELEVALPLRLAAGENRVLPVRVLARERLSLRGALVTDQGTHALPERELPLGFLDLVGARAVATRYRVAQLTRVELDLPPDVVGGTLDVAIDAGQLAVFGGPVRAMVELAPRAEIRLRTGPTDVLGLTLSRGGSRRELRVPVELAREPEVGLGERDVRPEIVCEAYQRRGRWTEIPRKGARFDLVGRGRRRLRGTVGQGGLRRVDVPQGDGITVLDEQIAGDGRSFRIDFWSAPPNPLWPTPIILTCFLNYSDGRRQRLPIQAVIRPSLATRLVSVLALALVTLPGILTDYVHWSIPSLLFGVLVVGYLWVSQHWSPQMLAAHLEA